MRDYVYSTSVLVYLKALLGCLIVTSLFFACGTDEKVKEAEISSTELSINEQIAQATAAINKNRFDAAAFHRRAQLHLVNRSIQAAEDDLKVAMKIDNTTAQYHFTLSDIHFAKGDIVLATEAISDGLELDPKNVTAMLALAELYYAMRDMKRSVVLLKKVLEIEQYNPQAYLIHGLIFIELEDTARALASLQRATEHDPELLEAYLELGMINYHRLNPLTVDYLNNVIALNPKHELAIYTKAMFLQKTLAIDQAIETYNQLLEVSPEHTEANFNIGHIQFEHKGDYDTAILYFDKTIAADTSHFKAYYMRGLSMESKARYKEARDDYQKALKLETNYALAIEGLNRLDRDGH